MLPRLGSNNICWFAWNTFSFDFDLFCISSLLIRNFIIWSFDWKDNYLETMISDITHQAIRAKNLDKYLLYWNRLQRCPWELFVNLCSLQYCQYSKHWNTSLTDAWLSMIRIQDVLKKENHRIWYLAYLFMSFEFLFVNNLWKKFFNYSASFTHEYFICSSMSLGDYKLVIMLSNKEESEISF